MTTTSASTSLRTLGNSDLQLTSIGFGAWAIGGGNWEFAWGPQDDNESIAAIHRALDLGINWIDTAAIYGLGHSEEIVGRALKSTQPQAAMSSPSAPCAGIADRSIYRSLKAGSLAEELEDSLRRLAWRRSTSTRSTGPIRRTRSKRAGKTLARIQGAGQDALDRRVQLSRRADEARAEDRAHHQPAAALLDAAPRHREGDSAFRAGNDIGVINYSPMVSGLLTGKMTAERVALCRRMTGAEGSRIQ